jgi:hypothetical protein
MPTIWHKNAAYCNHGDLMNTAENTIWTLEQSYSIELTKIPCKTIWMTLLTNDPSTCI